MASEFRKTRCIKIPAQPLLTVGPLFNPLLPLFSCSAFWRPFPVQPPGVRFFSAFWRPLPVQPPWIRFFSALSGARFLFSLLAPYSVQSFASLFDRKIVLKLGFGSFQVASVSWFLPRYSLSFPPVSLLFLILGSFGIVHALLFCSRRNASGTKPSSNLLNGADIS